MVLKYVHYGHYFGYPPCCIQAFIDRYKANKKPSEYLKAAGKGTGFIPCEYHAELILSKKMTIEDCICGRICEKPFCIH
jgi:hypothetical protein